MPENLISYVHKPTQLAGYSRSVVKMQEKYHLVLAKKQQAANAWACREANSMFRTHDLEVTMEQLYCCTKVHPHHPALATRN